MIIFMQILSVGAQEKVHPAITSGGGIYDLEGVKDPDPDIDYQLFVDLKTESQPGAINAGLNNVARMINLHRAGGIAVDRLKVAVAIHGPATYLVMDDAAYEKKYGVENPNSVLIQEMSQKGVAFYVCGQSLIGRGVARVDVNEAVTVGLSMLTIASEFLMKDYEMFVFE
jgi:intracellular sulfur oxidation DsrE/DsrF family protein